MKERSEYVCGRGRVKFFFFCLTFNTVRAFYTCILWYVHVFYVRSRFMMRVDDVWMTRECACELESAFGGLLE